MRRAEPIFDHADGTILWESRMVDETVRTWIVLIAIFFERRVALVVGDSGGRRFRWSEIQVVGDSGDRRFR